MPRKTGMKQLVSSAHWSLMVKKYLAKHNGTALEHLPYSLDLSPSDIFLFP
jgi:hypothetical protein